MISFVRKHSSLLSTAIILLAFAAAPYLIPENPDSSIFRSGSLTLVLLLTCMYPVKHALNAQSLRSLLYGFVFGLLFAISLSLGAELRIYDGLLPGSGSLVRRLAVPVMITPLFGTFASFAFSFMPKQVSNAAKPLPYLAFFSTFALCYVAVLLALWPGVISYDFQHEIKQFTEGVYLAAHPIFHTLLLGNLFALGEKIFGSMTAGAALYHMIQLLLLAAMYAWACTFIQKRIPYRIVVLVLAAGFSFLPFHSVLAVSTAKDPLFAGLCTVLCLLLWEIAENRDAFLSNRFRMIRFALCCLATALLRHNSVFAYVPACAALLILCRNEQKKALLVISLSLALTLFIPKGLELSVDAQKTPSTEMMSIPCQQLMRTAHRGNLPEEEYTQIERWFPNAVHTYRANCADPAKGGNFNFNRYQANPYDFWSTYAKYALKYPRIYLEAFLENCIGLWYPDDISHAHTLSNEENEYIYLNTTYPFAPETYPITPDCKLPALQKILYASTHHSKHQDYPFLSQLFCPATYTFLLLLTTLLFFFRRERRLALCTLPLWGIFLSLLFSAGIFIRYAYPLMAGVPLLFALAFFRERKA